MGKEKREKTKSEKSQLGGLLFLIFCVTFHKFGGFGGSLQLVIKDLLFEVPAVKHNMNSISRVIDQQS